MVMRTRSSAGICSTSGLQMQLNLTRPAVMVCCRGQNLLQAWESLRRA